MRDISRRPYASQAAFLSVRRKAICAIPHNVSDRQANACRLVQNAETSAKQNYENGLIEHHYIIRSAVEA